MEFKKMEFGDGKLYYEVNSKHKGFAYCMGNIQIEENCLWVFMPSYGCGYIKREELSIIIDFIDRINAEKNELVEKLTNMYYSTENCSRIDEPGAIIRWMVRHSNIKVELKK